MKQEFLRKTIHISGIFLIPLLLWKKEIFSFLLFLFLVIYLFIEILDRKNKKIFFLTALTQNSKRPHEKNKLSRGALFLSLSGIILPFLFGPHAAAIGLSQTFVADTAASLIGMKWGKKKIFGLQKSWMGSLAFFLTAFVVSLYFVSYPQALFLASVGTLLEALSIKEMDNLLIPLGVGAASFFILQGL